MEWEEIGQGDLTTWDSPKVIVGVYRGFTETSGFGGNGVQKRHTVEGDDGQVYKFFAPSILESRLSDPRVQPGVRIRIEYTGRQVRTKSGRLAKEFLVAVAK